MTNPAKDRAVAELAPDDPCLAGCRAGRPEAIDKLYRTYGGMVEGVIGRLVGPTPDFEDLVQTTQEPVHRMGARSRGTPGRFRACCALPRLRSCSGSSDMQIVRVFD